MNKDDKATIFDFLVQLLNRRGDSPDKINALLEYFRETSENDTGEKLLHRASGIFSKDITSLYASHVAAQVEVAHHKIRILEERIGRIESTRRDQPIQWLVIQAIAWFVSLSAALLALYLGLKG